MQIGWNIQMHSWDIRKTIIMKNLNCKMQAHVRVCKENIEKTTVKDAYRKNFVVKNASLKDHIGRVERRIKMLFSRMIHHNREVLVL